MTDQTRAIFLGTMLSEAIAQLKERRTKSVRFSIMERQEVKYIAPDDEIELGDDGLPLPPPTLTVEVRY